MAGRQAKTLSNTTLKRVLGRTSCSRTPERDRVIVLLSLRAGLRACEIAGLDWSMVLDARGCLGPAIEIRDVIAKRGGGRRVPLHRELREALVALKRVHAASSGPIIVSARGGPMRANSLVNWFVSLYREVNATGCSSHSGRRTFITHAARAAPKVGASLRDVQLLAGHRSIETTQRYIDGDTDAQRRLVARL
jgi:integrase/recombinase XerD